MFSPSRSKFCVSLCKLGDMFHYTPVRVVLIISKHHWELKMMPNGFFFLRYLVIFNRVDRTKLAYWDIVGENSLKREKFSHNRFVSIKSSKHRVKKRLFISCAKISKLDIALQVLSPFTLTASYQYILTSFSYLIQISAEFTYRSKSVAVATEMPNAGTCTFT